MLHSQKDSQYSKQNLSDQDRELYKQLFVNRDDVYLVQKAGGDYAKIASPLTDSILFSDQTIGTYQLDRQSQIKYACLDFDLAKPVHERRDYMTEAEWNAMLEKIRDYVKSVYTYIRGLGIPCFPEFSGFKGYHLWFFLEGPTPAADVRRWLKHLDALLPVSPTDIDLEIFPKQDEIHEDGYGNVIKFPLQRNRKSGKYAVFLDDAFEPIVGLPQISYTTLIELPKLPEVSKVVAKAVRTDLSASKPEISLSKLSVIEKNCSYLRKLIDRIKTENHLDHSERIWLANLLMPFGGDVVHGYLSGCSDYDHEYTEQQLSSLAGVPSLCSSSPMCAVEKCPLMKEIGKESPIAFTYRVLAHDEVDPNKPWVFYNAKAQRHHYLYQGDLYGIPKEELKTLYSNFGLKQQKKQKILFPTFDPNDPWHINLLNRTINFFQPSEYMKLERDLRILDPGQDFPTIYLLLSNVIPKPDERDRFLNWLATIFNTLKKMRTSFVFLGAQGAGKNAMFEHILAPLFGRGQSKVVKNEELESQFNPYMRQAFFLAFDEVAHDNSSRNRINSKLKAYITDDRVTINDKNDKTYVTENRMNCVFFSNEAIPLIVEGTDRRFSIIRTGGNLAKQQFFTGDTFFQKVSSELKSFAQYLRNFPYDENLANTALENVEKTSLAAAGMSKIEEFAVKLKANDGQSLLDAIDPEYGCLYLPEIPVVLPNAINRAEAKKLYQAIYGEGISTQALSKKLALYGISIKKITEWMYVW
jgi:hypothetical protein